MSLVVHPITVSLLVKSGVRVTKFSTHSRTSIPLLQLYDTISPLSTKKIRARGRIILSEFSARTRKLGK
jgi:hypothetical protein